MIHDVGFESITLDPKAEVKPSPQIEPTGELSLTAATMEVQKPVPRAVSWSLIRSAVPFYRWVPTRSEDSL